MHKPLSWMLDPQRIAHWCLIALLSLNSGNILAEERMNAPQAKKQPHSMTIHGDTRLDNYYWLRDDERQSPEVLDYLEQENRYTQQMLAPGETLREEIYTELVGRMKQDDQSVPYTSNGYTYRTVYVSGKNYPIYQRKPATRRAENQHNSQQNNSDQESNQDDWQTLIDGNQRAEGSEFYRLGALAISPDNKIIAVAEDKQGRNNFSISFRQVDDNAWQNNVLQGTSGNIVWAADSNTLFYVHKHPKTLLPYQVYRHQYGSAQQHDQKIYEELDDTFYISLSKSTSKQYILVAITSTETAEYRLIDAANSQHEMVTFKPRETGIEYYLDHFKDNFYLRANHENELFGLYSTDRPGNNWKTVIAPREGIDLEDFELFNQWLVTEERENGLVKLRQINWQTQEERYIPLDDPAYMVWIGYNPEPDSDYLRYGYSSMTTPTTTFEINMCTQERQLLKQQDVKGFNGALYASKRVWIEAQDGVKVPVSLVYRSDLFKTGDNPLLVYGYGAYGASMDPSFSSSRLSLLDRGFVYAIAHIRGGGELGKKWYNQGKLANKKNTFTDFIDVTNGLISLGYGHPEHIYAMGGSAGGLLMGAVINMAPELYQGVVAAVPFVDVMTTMLDASIPLTTGEYDEWGDPNQPKAYFSMLAYSPYDNIKPQRYPHLLVTTGLHDSQVQYWEPAKWVAKLRDYKQGNSLLLLETNMSAGHGGKSGRFSALEDIATEYSFLLMLENKANYFPQLN